MCRIQRPDLVEALGGVCFTIFDFLKLDFLLGRHVTRFRVAEGGMAGYDERCWV